jgi:ribokinase
MTVQSRTPPPDRASGGPGPVVVAGSHGQSLFLRVDAVPRQGETVLAWGYDEPEDGGKATNQAIAAARLGAPVRVVTLLGSDERGELWLARLKRAGIDVTYARRVDGATDVGFVMLPPSGIPAIASGRDLSAQLAEREVQAAAGAFDDASVVVCQLEAPAECARASFRLGRAAGATTILNPAPAQPIDAELAALTDVLVPNEHEAAALNGSLAPPDVLSARLAERFGCAVIVTAGDKGCFVTETGETCEVPAPGVEVVDTTGAGDAFVGALAVALRTGEELLAAARFATEVASRSVTRPGTIPSYPTSKEIAPRASTSAEGSA